MTSQVLFVRTTFFVGIYEPVTPYECGAGTLPLCYTAFLKGKEYIYIFFFLSFHCFSSSQHCDQRPTNLDGTVWERGRHSQRAIRSFGSYGLPLPYTWRVLGTVCWGRRYKVESRSHCLSPWPGALIIGPKTRRYASSSCKWPQPEEYLRFVERIMLKNAWKRFTAIFCCS